MSLIYFIAVDNRIHYRTVGNQALAEVMAQAYHLSDLDVYQPAKNWQCNGWRYVHTERDVHILKRDTNERDMYSVAGVGIIPKTPEYLYDTIRDPYFRFQYDKLLKVRVVYPTWFANQYMNVSAN